MNGRAQPSAILRAIRLLIPESEIRVIHERRWDSLRFAGTKICLSAQIPHAKMVRKGEELRAILTDFEFDLPGQLVADSR